MQAKLGDANAKKTLMCDYPKNEKSLIENKEAHKNNLLVIDKPHNLIWVVQVFQIRNVHINVIVEKNLERDARLPKTKEPKTNIWKMSNINHVSVTPNM